MQFFKPWIVIFTNTNYKRQIFLNCNNNNNNNIKKVFANN